MILYLFILWNHEVQRPDLRNCCVTGARLVYGSQKKKRIFVQIIYYCPMAMQAY
jgi:hypothetical protein